MLLAGTQQFDLHTVLISDVDARQKYSGMTCLWPCFEATVLLPMMKKTSSPQTKAVKDLRAEYHFDYRQSRRNRFVEQVEPAAVVVVLDPDVAQVFTTPESVNTALRALITAMPQLGKRRAVRKHPAS
jgi:hypothetical protein